MKTQSNDTVRFVSRLGVLVALALPGSLVNGNDFPPSAPCLDNGDLFSEAIRDPAVKVGIVRVEGGISLVFHSDNPLRAEELRVMAVTILKMKALCTQAWSSNGYGLDPQ